MSEGYQFQVDVWQPSPDAKPAVERHIVHGRVVEIGPNWVAEQLSRIAESDTPKSHAIPPLVPPALSGDCEAVRAGWNLGSPHPKSHLAQSARWVHGGLHTTASCYGGESTEHAVIASELLGLRVCPRSSHRNRLRPAPLVGAFGRWIKRHPVDADKIKVAASIYSQHAADILCGMTVASVSPMAILARWMKHASTSGVDSKKKIYRAACDAIASYVDGKETANIFALSEVANSTINRDPIP